MPLHRAGLDEVENRPKGTSELEALSRLHVALGQVGIVKYEHTGNIAVAGSPSAWSYRASMDSGRKVRRG